jgi:hypothetical protein
MLHAYVERFDVMGGRGNILGWDGEVNKAYIVFQVSFVQIITQIVMSDILNIEVGTHPCLADSNT